MVKYLMLLKSQLPTNIDAKTYRFLIEVDCTNKLLETISEIPSILIRQTKLTHMFVIYPPEKKYPSVTMSDRFSKKLCRKIFSIYP